MTTTILSTGIELDFRDRLVDGFNKLLESIDCENVNVEIIEPFTTWHQVSDALHIKGHPTLPDSYIEGWFVNRGRITDFQRGANSKYVQEHSYIISGVSWRGTWENTYLYLQDKTDILVRTLELNKGFALYANEIVNIQVNFDISMTNILNQGGTEAVQLYKTEVGFTLIKERTESSGRVTS